MPDISLEQNAVQMAGTPRTMPNRWSNINQTVSDFGSSLQNQYQMGQQLQVDQAKQLAQWKMYADLYGGSPQIDAALNANPFGRYLASSIPKMGGGQGSPQGQGSGFGMQPTMSPLTGQMMFMPTMGGASMTSTTPNATPSATPQTGGGNFSAFNPVGSGPVITGGSQSMKTPFGETSTSMQNPQGAAMMAAATEAGRGSQSPQVAANTKLAEEQANAQIGLAKDTSQLGLIAKSYKNLLDLHKSLADKGLAGNAEAAFKVDNYNKIPNFGFGGPNGMFGINPNDSKDIGKYVSARNETLLKTQPILSQQIGGANGSTRIMESVLKLAGAELGDLSTPHSQMIGQTEGTVGTLYRIQQASQQYLDLLKSNGIDPKTVNPDEAAAQITNLYSKMADMTPEQSQQVGALLGDVTGGNGGSGTPNTPSQSNPIKIGKYTAY